MEFSFQKIREWSRQEGISVILASGAVVTPLVRAEKEALTYA